MITKQTVVNFRTDFAKAIENLEKKYGVKIEMKSISYTDTEFHFKTICTELSEAGEKQVNLDNFNWLKKVLGFEGNIGDSYKSSEGITYTIYDLDGKKPKFPVLLKGSNGKQYKATVASVNLYLKYSNKGNSPLTK